MSFQQGLSGLNATSKSLEVIGNNIANANTYGAKSSRAEFADVYAASLNGTGSSTVGIGTQLAAVSQQFTQGSISATDNPMDLAINGRGFFQLRDPSGITVYSRNGQFKVDRQGYIVNNQGQQLQVRNWDDTLARFNEVPGSIRIDTGMGVGQMTGAGASETDRGIKLQMNFDSRIELADSQLNLADGTRVPFDFANDRTYDFTFADRVYGEGGTPLEMTYYFRLEPLPGAGVQTQYEWRVYAKIDGKQFDPLTGEVYRGATGDPAAPPAIPLASLTFEDGRVLAVRDAAGNAIERGDPVTMNINDPTDRALVDGTGALLPVDQQRPLFGALPFEIWDSTLMPTAFDVGKITQDGYEPGQLVGVSFDEQGLLQATYSNGRAKALGQLVLFDFTNVQGLKPRGGNAWEATFASGDASQPKVPGQGGMGVLQPGALEESNVDLTAELVNMITAQRIYQANAQTIKTVDQIMQTLVNLR